MDISLTLAALTVLVSLVWLAIRSSRRLNSPPGPWGLPFLGNINFIRMGHRMQLYIDSLHEKYGDIISFRLGVLTFVYVKSGAVIRRIFASDDFSDRQVGKISFAKAIIGDEPGGIFLSGKGPQHLEMRKFVLAAFRDFGVGKKSLDEMVQTECTAFSQMLEQAAEDSDGVVSELKIKTQSCAASIIHNIIFGFRYDFDDPLWTEVRKNLRIFFSFNPLAVPENFFPFLRYFPFINRLLFQDMFRKIEAANKYLEAYVNKQIEEHRSSYCEGEIRDFIDLYIQYENESRPFYTSRNIFLTIMDIFRAGTDTTATTLAWCIQYLVKYPDIQKQLHQEVDEVIGDRVFERKEKNNLVKMRAFLNEVLRYVTVAGQTPPHTVPVATKLENYTVPANSFVFCSIYSIHHDKQYWGDPENFRIERWIGDNGEVLLHEDHFLPFSTGKRVCIGRQLVLIETVIFLVEALRKFRFEKWSGDNQMSDESLPGIVRSPKNFHLKVVRRS